MENLLLIYSLHLEKMRLFSMIFKHCEILSISVVCRLVGQRKGIAYASAVMSIDILFSSFLLFVIELERPRESYIRNSPISVARQLRQEECFPPPSRISNGRGKSCFCFSLQFCYAAGIFVWHSDWVITKNAARCSFMHWNGKETCHSMSIKIQHAIDIDDDKTRIFESFSRAYCTP